MTDTVNVPPEAVVFAIKKADLQFDNKLSDYRYRSLAAAALAAAAKADPVEVTIFCPKCAVPHVDDGEWATTRHHKTHQCQDCGHEWRPFPFATIGVPHPSALKTEPMTRSAEYRPEREDFLNPAIGRQYKAPKAEPNVEVKAIAYVMAHETIKEMGYPSLTEALEDLDRLRAKPEAPKVEQEPVEGIELHSPEEQIDWLMRDRAGVIAEHNHAEAEIVRLQSIIDTHPAPASDELLEALERADAAIGGADISKIRHSEGGVDLAKKVVDLKAASQNLIAKRKGPQS